MIKCYELKIEKDDDWFYVCEKQDKFFISSNKELFSDNVDCWPTLNTGTILSDKNQFYQAIKNVIDECNKFHYNNYIIVHQNLQNKIKWIVIASTKGYTDYPIHWFD